jgi:hypothetical protein
MAVAPLTWPSRPCAPHQTTQPKQPARRRSRRLLELQTWTYPICSLSGSDTTSSNANTTPQTDLLTSLESTKPTVRHAIPLNCVAALRVSRRNTAPNTLQPKRSQAISTTASPRGGRVATTPDQGSWDRLFRRPAPTHARPVRSRTVTPRGWQPGGHLRPEIPHSSRSRVTMIRLSLIAGRSLWYSGCWRCPMSFVLAVPEMVRDAATDLVSIGSSL